jgi:hypothetical protein
MHFGPAKVRGEDVRSAGLDDHVCFDRCRINAVFREHDSVRSNPNRSFRWGYKLVPMGAWSRIVHAWRRRAYERAFAVP